MTPVDAKRGKCRNDENVVEYTILQHIFRSIQIQWETDAKFGIYHTKFSLKKWT